MSLTKVPFQNERIVFQPQFLGEYVPTVTVGDQQRASKFGRKKPFSSHQKTVDFALNLAASATKARVRRPCTGLVMNCGWRLVLRLAQAKQSIQMLLIQYDSHNLLILIGTGT